METKHTATPWEVNGSLVVKDCYGKVICDTDVSLSHPPKRYVERAEARANAEFIIRAVNAHDELVEALLTALPFVEDAMDDPAFKEGAVRKRLESIRAALAKATGE